MIAAWLAACGPPPPATPGDDTAARARPGPVQLVYAAEHAGLVDLHCRAAPGTPLTVARDGIPIATGTGSLTVAAHDVEAGTWACEAPQGRDERVLDAPGGNLMVLLLDDVGIDNVAAYGAADDAPPTPTLDRLAATGVRFEVAWAMPMCSPTRATLLTGRRPHRHGVGTLIDAVSAYALPTDEVTLPEVLARAGWTSALAGKWHLSPVSPDYVHHPADHGFAWHGGSHQNLRVHAVADPVPHGYWHWEKNTNGTLAYVDDYATSVTVDDALQQAATLPEPWFLYVSFNAAHIPYDPPPPHLVGVDNPPDPSADQKYDALLTALDAELGRLLDGLDPALLARTTVITLGDNGTPADAITPPLDPVREKGTLFEAGVRVPFLVTGPLVRRPGTVSDAFVDVTDVLPTAAALAGVPLDDGVERDGISLLPYLYDPDRPSSRDVLYAEKFEPNGRGTPAWTSRAVKDATHRLIDPADGVLRLFRAPPDALFEGDNLLLGDEPLAPDDAAALERLTAALDATR